jgi:hypothetical protein
VRKQPWEELSTIFQGTEDHSLELSHRHIVVSLSLSPASEKIKETKEVTVQVVLAEHHKGKRLIKFTV